MEKTELYTTLIIGTLFMVLISSCGLAPGKTADLDGSSWSLESYGEKALLPDTTMTAIFEEAEISGSASCNHYFATYRIRSNQFSVEGLGWTEMACMDPEGIMSQEQEIMQLLGSAATFELQGQRLIIKTASGEELVFKPLQSN